jgi:integrase/recombinase XerC
MAGKRRDLEGSAQLFLAPNARLIHPEETVFTAMLEGWRAQMRSRLLSPHSIEARLRMVRRFATFTNDYPWSWVPGDLDDWSSSLFSGKKPLAHSTVRGYQLAIAMFLDYLTDDRYGWAQECEARFSTHPIQICHEWNVATHSNGYEGRPEVRPFSRDELQDFFDFCDDRVAETRRLGRKGWLTAFRDSALFKTIYAWGLRRREAARLDLVDFGSNASVPEFGNYGMLSVRWGKAVKGSSPRRRNVLSVMRWAVDVIDEYVSDIRPLYPDGPQLWPTERGSTVSSDYISVRFAQYRDRLGMPDELHPHCLRHSYVTHLIEDGLDPFFVQQQVGHRWGSTTALYTGVSSDYKNRMLRNALDQIYRSVDGEGRKT